MRLRHLIGKAGIGQDRSLAGPWRNDRFLIRNWTIEPITAAHNDLFVS